MANEDQHERQNDDPTIYIDKIRIYKDAEAKRDTLQSKSAPDQSSRPDRYLSEEKERIRKAQLIIFDERAKILDVKFKSSPQYQAQQAERNAQEQRAKVKTKAEADAILRRHAEWDQARSGSNQQHRKEEPIQNYPQPSATGSSGTGCVISVVGFIVLVACFFALAELRLFLVPALRAGSLFPHIASLLSSGGK